MSTFRNPVGPETPNVYWRRRLIVGIGVVVVIVVILLIVFAPKGSKTPAVAQTSTAPTNASTPVPTVASGDAPACVASDLVVTATIDKAKFSVEEQPQFGFTIENKGKAACTATAGSDVQVFTVTSGKDVVWLSTDCQTKPAPATTVIQPGDKVTGGPVPWDRTRSSKTTCDATRTPVPVGFYHISVAVNGVKSAVSPQFQIS